MGETLPVSNKAERFQEEFKTLYDSLDNNIKNTLKNASNEQLATRLDKYSKTNSPDYKKAYHTNAITIVLQTALLRLGYTQVGTVDGYYGEKTQQAVRDFQLKEHLKQDGRAGQATIGRIVEELGVRSDTASDATDYLKVDPTKYAVAQESTKVVTVNPLPPEKKGVETPESKLKQSLDLDGDPTAEEKLKKIDVLDVSEKGNVIEIAGKKIFAVLTPPANGVDVYEGPGTYKNVRYIEREALGRALEETNTELFETAVVAKNFIETHIPGKDLRIKIQNFLKLLGISSTAGYRNEKDQRVEQGTVGYAWISKPDETGAGYITFDQNLYGGIKRAQNPIAMPAICFQNLE